MVTLLVVSILVSKDVLYQYISKATSFKQYEEDISEKESITIVFEFWPLKKMNYNKSIPYQLYERWILGKDFSLSFGVTDFKTAQEMVTFQENIEEYRIEHSSIGKVTFNQLTTTWGNCFKISANMINVKPLYRAFLQINFDDIIVDEDIPKIELIVSSEDNSYGKTMSDWLDGNTVLFDNIGGFLWTEIQPKKIIKMKSHSDCSDIGFYNCFHFQLEKQNYNHCPRNCFSISTYGNATPLCETIEEYQCAHKITKDLKKNSTCLPSCSQINYSLETHFQEDLEEPNAKRNITFAYRFLKSRMKVEEEYVIHDFVGMLGTIGGTLGLFIRFSFLGGLNFILHHLQVFMEKIATKNIQDQNIIHVGSKSSSDEIRCCDGTFCRKCEEVKSTIRTMNGAIVICEERILKLEKDLAKLSLIQKNRKH